MVWCSHCEDDCDTTQDTDKGYVCCFVCGKVLDQLDDYNSGPTFEKSGGGQSRLSGSILRSVASACSLSRERTLEKGRHEIYSIVLFLSVTGGDSMINKAYHLYKIAVERNFTKGRRTSHVAAACLYIACRQTEKEFLLIDFSDYLKISVYVLGAVFLQLCKLLRLSDHPIVQKLIDPSLFIHRFTDRLLGGRNNPVSEVALRIVASMKRDWMQTGRKPSGLCGAALYISALSHGFNYSKSDIVTVVHICEATLTKRLIEFENTDSGCLTIEDFIARADELNNVSQSYQFPTPGQVLCAHKDTNEPHFAHGLCRECFNEEELREVQNLQPFSMLKGRGCRRPELRERCLKQMQICNRLIYHRRPLQFPMEEQHLFQKNLNFIMGIQLLILLLAITQSRICMKKELEILKAFLISMMLRLMVIFTMRRKRNIKRSYGKK